MAHTTSSDLTEDYKTLGSASEHRGYSAKDSMLCSSLQDQNDKDDVAEYFEPGLKLGLNFHHSSSGLHYGQESEGGAGQGQQRSQMSPIQVDSPDRGMVETPPILSDESRESPPLYGKRSKVRLDPGSFVFVLEIGKIRDFYTLHF